MRLVIPME